jgi:hypothetical protein
MEAGKRARAKTRGPKLPKSETNTPPAIKVAKQEVTIDLRLKLRESLR